MYKQGDKKYVNYWVDLGFEYEIFGNGLRFTNLNNMRLLPLKIICMGLNTLRDNGITIISLWLDNCNLHGIKKYIPKDNDAWNKLQSLYCSHNQLTELPNLPINLQTLYCSNNQLNELPNLPNNLQHLHCVINPLRELIIPKSCRILNKDWFRNYNPIEINYI